MRYDTPVGRCLSSLATRRYGWLCLAVVLLACRREPAAQKDKPAKPASATTATGSASVQRPASPTPTADRTSRIYLVEQRDLFGLSGDEEALVFDRQRPRLALRTKEGCAVWGLSDDAYLGLAPVQSCADWIAPTGDPRAPDRSRELNVAKERLGIVPLTGPGAKIVVQGRALAPTCRALEIARWSPDSQKIAVSCAGDSHIYILDSHTGMQTATLPLDPTKRVQNLAWGAAGLVAVISPLVSPDDCHCHAHKLIPEKDKVADKDDDDDDGRDDGLPGDVCQQIMQDCKTQDAPLPSWVKSSPCRHIAKTRLSSDKQQVAIACAEDGSHFFVANATTLALTEHKQRLLLDADEKLCWQSGILWRLGGFFDFWTRQSCDLDEANLRLGSLYLWSSPTAQPRIQELKDPDLIQEANLRSTFYLDPLGRYVLQAISWRSGSALRTYDVTTGRLGPLSWTVYDNARPPYYLSVSRWLPGKFPVWESIESTEPMGSPQQRAWRIYTAPGKRTLALVDLGDTSLPPLSKVLDDGTTVVAEPTAVDLGSDAPPTTDAGVIKAATDPSGRFLGTGKDSLRRLSDGEELSFGAQGGTRTARGVFDGPLDVVSSLIFRIGDDPARGTIVHGDQLASLLYHPNLTDDFFDGKPVDQPLLSQPLGLPPRLTEVAPAELQPGGNGLVFHVRADDSGDGAAVVRRWVENHPVGEALAVLAGQPVAIPVSLPKTGCSSVRLYACNRLGYVCSKAVRREYCPPGTKRPDMATPER